MRDLIIRPGDTINLGRQGENIAEQVQFDVAGWSDLYGAGTYSLRLLRPGESIPYEAEVSTSGERVLWNVTETDTAIRGMGEAQLILTVGDIVAKTQIYHTMITPSIGGDPEPPDPAQDWFDQLKGFADAAEESASDAEAWAVGERGGQAVPQSDETYRNNAKFYADQADTAKQSAEYFEGRAAQNAEYAYNIQMSVEQTAQDVLLYKGAPLVAATAAAMTDHNRVYVYVGSETGYTAGNWYYWDGAAWTSGGVYNSSALQTDKTLSVADAAADAEATGAVKNTAEYIRESYNTGLIAYGQEGTVSGTGIDAEQDGNRIKVNGESTATASQGFSKLLLCDHLAVWRATETPNDEKVYPLVLKNGHTYKITIKAISGTMAPTDETTRANYVDLRSADDDGALITIKLATNKTEASGTIIGNGKKCSVRLRLGRLITFTNLVLEILLSDETVDEKADAAVPVRIPWELFEDDELAPLGWQTGRYNGTGETANSTNEIRTYRSRFYTANTGDQKIIFKVPTGYHAAIIEYDENGENGARYGDLDSGPNEQTIDAVPGNQYRFCVGGFNGDAEDYLTAEFIATLQAYAAKAMDVWQKEQDDRISALEAGDQEIPGYYATYLQTKLNEITARRVSMSANMDEFMFITDYHHQYNAGNSLALLRQVSMKTGIQKLFYAGDAGGAKGTSDSAVYKRFQISNEVWGQMESAVPKMYGVLGNHEHINGGKIPYKASVNAYLNRYKSDPIVLDPATGCYFVDNPANKVRYYFIQETSTAYPTTESVDWLGKQLALVPEGYAVALITHHAYIPSAATAAEYDGVEITYEHTQNKALSQMLHAYMVKGAFTYADVVYNYSGLSGNRPVIGIFCGHFHHGYMYTGSTATGIEGINVFRASTDCMHAASIDVDGAPWYWENGTVGGTKVVREYDTVLEQCFYVVQIDLDSGDVYVTAIGGDHDWTATFQAG